MGIRLSLSEFRDARVRGAVLFCLAVILAACTTTSDPAPEVRTISSIGNSTSSLPAQTLAPGACGLFGWDISIRPSFVFFATAERALYLSGEGSSPELLIPKEPFPSSDYGTLKLILGEAEPLVEGTRYAQARVSQVLDDGFTRVRPLVILQSCQTPEQTPTVF